MLNITNRGNCIYLRFLRGVVVEEFACGSFWNVRCLLRLPSRVRGGGSGYAFGMKPINRFTVFVAVALLWQWPFPAHAARDKKATKALITVTFEAHNEGTGEIYGEENLVTVTIDSVGIRYQGKGNEKAYTLKWDQVSGWQPNRFTSYSTGRAAGGDFGIGIYQDARYFSFRTHNGADFAAAVKALRAFALAKERTGMG